MNINWKLVLIIVSCLLLGFFSHKWLGHDNIIEEHIEAIIENNTGIDYDFTPYSKEDY